MSGQVAETHKNYRPGAAESNYVNTDVFGVIPAKNQSPRLIAFDQRRVTPQLRIVYVKVADRVVVE